MIVMQKEDQRRNFQLKSLMGKFVETDVLMDKKARRRSGWCLDLYLELNLEIVWKTRTGIAWNTFCKTNGISKH